MIGLCQQAHESLNMGINFLLYFEVGHTYFRIFVLMLRYEYKLAPIMVSQPRLFTAETGDVSNSVPRGQ